MISNDVHPTFVQRCRSLNESLPIVTKQYYVLADSEEKLCTLVSEFGRVCERRKLRVNVGKSKVMRCSRYGNGGRMHVMLNSEPLEEVDCFKYLGSQMAADGRCEIVWYTE